MGRWTGLLVLLALAAVTSAGAWAQETQEPASASEGGQESASTAERVARLKRSIGENERLLAELRARLDDPESEYFQAEAAFTQLDREFEQKKRELSRLREEGRGEEADALELELASLAQRRQLARERFDLAIEERRTVQEQIAALEQQVRQDRAELEELVGPVTASQPAGSEASSEAPSAPPASAPPEPEQIVPGEEVSDELLKIQQELQSKLAEAEKARSQVRGLAERIELLSRTLELERKYLETARRKAENARQTEQMLSSQAHQLMSEGTPFTELRELWEQVAEARRRYREAQAEVERRVDRLDELEAELRQLQSEQIAALQRAEARRREAEQARRRLEWLQNPFAPQNLLRWAVQRGPRVLGILVGMLVVLWLARRVEAHIIRLLAGRAERGTREDRENRARTLVGVFHSAVTVAVVAGGSLMILTELGVSIVPLMGGAAVVGLAVAFGAQNLIRDYFYGFMILLENQYTVNDVVKIGDISGQVERITLRLTVLRSLDGTVHFIPNGEITRVSNLTHGWSRAVLDVPVAYRENVDRVMQVVTEVAEELRRDPQYGPMVLEPPEMLGVNELADSAVVVRMLVKTRPLKQWPVRRELLRRIKRRFDELGIEIPFPHRTVYHRYDGGPRGDAKVEAARPDFRD